MENFNEFSEEFFGKSEEFCSKMDTLNTCNVHVDILRARHMVDMIRTIPDINITLEVGDIKLDIMEKPEIVKKFLKAVAEESERQLESLKP